MGAVPQWPSVPVTARPSVAVCWFWPPADGCLATAATVSNGPVTAAGCAPPVIDFGGVGLEDGVVREDGFVREAPWALLRGVAEALAARAPLDGGRVGLEDGFVREAPWALLRGVAEALAARAPLDGGGLGPVEDGVGTIKSVGTRMVITGGATTPHQMKLTLACGEAHH